MQVPFGRFVVGKDSVKQKPAETLCLTQLKILTCTIKRRVERKAVCWHTRPWDGADVPISSLQHLMLFNSFVSNEVARTQRN